MQTEKRRRPKREISNNAASKGPVRWLKMAVVLLFLGVLATFVQGELRIILMAFVGFLTAGTVLVLSVEPIFGDWGNFSDSLWDAVFKRRWEAWLKVNLWGALGIGSFVIVMILFKLTGNLDKFP